MIDHTGVVVSDFEKSKAFYSAALLVIGYSLLMELPASLTGHTDVAGFGVHVAFRAATRAHVDAFYKAAVAAGGRDNGPPGLRLHYHTNYYGAFVLDPDGHNIEAVCHMPA
jgi:catechol 2,3-dioxygenase-like lactoylglutathione lyase family enzyme